MLKLFNAANDTTILSEHFKPSFSWIPVRVSGPHTTGNLDGNPKLNFMCFDHLLMIIELKIKEIWIVRGWLQNHGCLTPENLSTPKTKKIKLN